MIAKVLMTKRFQKTADIVATSSVEKIVSQASRFLIVRWFRSKPLS
jgi:hypothetical protein